MNKTSSDRKNEKLAGVFFISATATAITGQILYDPVLKNSDVLGVALEHSSRIAAGALFELILAFSNIATGILLYPRLKRYSESWGLGYALFRLLEVVFILIGLASMLVIVSMSRQAASASGPELVSLQVSAGMLKTVFSWVFVLGPHFMLGVNTFIYSTIFFKSNYMPRPLALVGMASAASTFLAAVLEIFGVIPHFSVQIIFFVLPIAVYEMVLASRLITKGFNPEAYATGA